jgi:SAM-dependent methyltransferase
MALDKLRNLRGRIKSKLNPAADVDAAVAAATARTDAAIAALEQRLAANEMQLSLLRWLMTSNTAYMVPPMDEGQYVGGGDFLQIGHEMLRLLIACAGLTPRDSVLDVGCGIGRVALPLTQFLSDNGRYEGFDVVPSLIDWCAVHIARNYPNFRFQCVDLVNSFYNPTGGLASSSFRFPYEDASFDLVFLTSVFTHMLPADVQHYMAEIARVLKPDGRLMTTVYLLNQESLHLISLGRSPITPGEDLGGYRIRLPEFPEESVFYDEPTFMGFLESNGLNRDLQTWYGAWCRGTGTTHQDLIVTRKQAS